jgi:hypothetical protein
MLCMCYKELLIAPRTADDRFAGNGGLSLRRVSAVKKILNFQSRYNDTEPEDEWFGKRITLLPGAKVASGVQEDHFAVEDIWHAKPMGYHVRADNLADDVWKDPVRRKSNFDYCPELSMVMDMKLEQERCEGDNKMGEILDEAAQRLAAKDKAATAARQASR